MIGEILGICSLAAWLILGAFIFMNSMNSAVVLTWIATTGTIVALIGSAYITKMERIENEMCKM